ncbi:MAG TPA: hypothetical protein PLQ13_14035, partial [Candidatus Krumholzibacteria bacterium]|nr:hypothetical protein [Candidatus Krumholzibacteria bacterium]
LGGLGLRDVLLEAWAVDGRGRPFHAGAPVFKNVAGYGLVPLLAGAGGMLATLQAVTLKLAPAPERVAWRRLRGDVAAAWPQLAPLLDEREPAPGAPVVLGDHGAGTMLVLVGGRDRPWDLGAWLARFDRAAAAAGLDGDGDGLAPPAELPTLLPHLAPAWAAAHPDWTVIAAGDGGPCPTAIPADRWIRGTTPALAWTPDAFAAAGLDQDPAWRMGRPTLPPPPPPGVPRALLGAIKDVFDPDRRLPSADWLPARGEGR